MLLIAGGIIVWIGVLIISRLRAARDVSASTIGWMSERWLVEHRASHSR
jgi:urea transporter